MNQLIMALATGLYVGKIARAPGTWGSLAAFAPWFFMKDLPLPTYLLLLGAIFILGFFVDNFSMSLIFRELHSFFKKCEHILDLIFN